MLGYPRKAGGDTEQASVMFGVSGERGRLLGGASYHNRDIIYTRDRDFWMSTRGTFIFSNNFVNAVPDPSNPVYGYSFGGAFRHPVYGWAVPGGCEDGLFWISGAGAGQTCQFDHKTRISTDVSDLTLRPFSCVVIVKSVLIGWAISMPRRAAQKLTDSLPRRRPARGRVEPFSFYDPATLFLTHRFAASGTRNSNTGTTTYDFLLGFQGQVGRFDLDAGVCRTESRYVSFGENYAVGGLVQQAITDGSYNIYDPYNNPADAVNGFTSTIGRDARTVNKDLFGGAGGDLFPLPGGTARAVESASKVLVSPISPTGKPSLIRTVAMILTRLSTIPAGGYRTYFRYIQGSFGLWITSQLNA